MNVSTDPSMTTKKINYRTLASDIDYKTLVKLVQQHCGFSGPDVRDVLHSLVVVMTKELAKDNTVMLEGIGRIATHQIKGRTFKSGLTGELHSTEPRRSITVKPDAFMQNALNPDAELLEQMKNGEVSDYTGQEKVYKRADITESVL